MPSQINNLHHRKSIRLKEYDYTSSAEYFITICTYQRECLFVEIKKDEMVLNYFGLIVLEEWLRTAEIRGDVELDSYVVMPNHIHGIITLIESGRGTSQRAPTKEQFGKPTSRSIPTIVRLFKACVTKRINLLRNTPRQSIWQRNYYEHIIRNDKDLINIRDYIINNPMQWHVDEENPHRGDSHQKDGG